MRIRSFRLVIASLVAWFVLAPPAVACGDMSVTLALMQQWPESRGPMVAEIRERRLDRLPAPSWTPAPNGDSVTVRQRRATEVLRAVQARLVESTPMERAPASFAVFFLNDHIWSRFEIADDVVRLRLRGLRPIEPLPGEARVHASARVFDVLVRGELDLAEAEASGVLLVDGEPQAVLATRKALYAAFAPQAG